MIKILHKISILLLIVVLTSSCGPEKKVCAAKNSNLYGAQFKIFSTLEDAKSCTIDQDKPILLVFEMINGSTRKSSTLLSKFIERKNLDEEYRIVFLYVDDKTPLLNEHKVEMPNGKIETVGDENTLIQIEMFNILATPHYAIVDQNLENLKEPHGHFSNDQMIEDFFKL